MNYPKLSLNNAIGWTESASLTQTKRITPNKLGYLHATTGAPKRTDYKLQAHQINYDAGYSRGIRANTNPLNNV